MDIVLFLQSIISVTEVKVLAALICANFILGVLAAVVSKTITLADLKNIWKRVLLVFGAYVSVAIVATVLTDFTAMRTAAWVTLIGYLGSQITTNIADILKGQFNVTIPESVLKFVEKS